MKATTTNETVVKSPLRISLTFLWIGFVCAISFMEAWIKFQAPGITLSLGLQEFNRNAMSMVLTLLFQTHSNKN